MVYLLDRLKQQTKNAQHVAMLDEAMEGVKQLAWGPAELERVG